MYNLHSFENKLEMNFLHEKALGSTNYNYFCIYILMMYLLKEDLRKGPRWDVRKVTASWMYSKNFNPQKL